MSNKKIKCQLIWNFEAEIINEDEEGWELSWDEFPDFNKLLLKYPLIENKKKFEVGF